MVIEVSRNLTLQPTSPSRFLRFSETWAVLTRSRVEKSRSSTQVSPWPMKRRIRSSIRRGWENRSRKLRSCFFKGGFLLTPLKDGKWPPDLTRIFVERCSLREHLDRK